MYEPDYRPRHAVLALALMTGLLVVAVILALVFLSAMEPLPYRDPEPPTTM